MMTSACTHSREQHWEQPQEVVPGAELWRRFAPACANVMRSLFVLSARLTDLSDRSNENGDMVSSTGQVVTEQALARNITSKREEGTDASMFVWEYPEFAASGTPPSVIPLCMHVESHMRHCSHAQKPKFAVL